MQLPNRDEFGTLAHNLNATSRELATMYHQLDSLNEQLRGTNTELLAQLQAQVEELARSRGLITQAEERLRRELAELLHSRVQNRLLMVWYRLEALQELLQSDPASAVRLVTDVRQQVDEIREKDVRELSHRLHPSIIRAGLLPALEELVEEMPRLKIDIEPAAEVEALDQQSPNGRGGACESAARELQELGLVVDQDHGRSPVGCLVHAGLARCKRGNNRLSRR